LDLIQTRPRNGVLAVISVSRYGPGPMSESTTPILHHYPSSPFSEKLRVLLGYKRLPWRSVITPAVMPKPDVLALTGGYRKTPILQLGSDIFCDTRLMAEVIEELAPSPSIYPKGLEASAAFLAQWADQTLFYSALPYAFQGEALVKLAGMLQPDEAAKFLEDRLNMGKDARYKPPPAHVAFSHMPVYFGQLDAQLQGRMFLLGDAPSIADFAVYHPMWFIAHGSAAPIAPYSSLRAWMDRMAAFGHGTFTELTSHDAIAECKSTPARARTQSLDKDSNGNALGTRVLVRPTDLGRDPVEGTLVHIAATRFAIERTDERAGTVTVWFPVIGYELKPIQG
jgi:glutathione S-transferase